jgi:hypothetical protein
MDIDDAESVSADFRNFDHVSRKCPPLLGKPSQILNNMQAFSNSWFERRHTGTKSASECSDRVCSTETMVDLMQAYQDWARGAVERMMADGLAWQQHIIAATGALTSPPLAPPMSEQASEPSRADAKAPARSKTG